MKEERDYIIVGQGIAGSVLAMKLMERGKKVAVFDQAENNSSSMVAAGIYNPITGRKMVLTWKAQVLWPAFLKFYSELEQRSGSRFLYPTSHYRPFRATEEVNEMTGRSAEPGYENFIEKICSSPQFEDRVNDPFGGIFLKDSGYLDIPVFLNTVREILVATGSYFAERLDPAELKVDGKAEYRNTIADKIIFCDGKASMDLPWFEWLPFRPVKGELIEIETESTFSGIINRGVFMLPRYDGRCLVGATYESSDLSLEITEKGKVQLENKLTDLIRVPYQIRSQRAGIRPSTLDRRPFVGLHPENETIGMLNGLGTKGVSLAPHFADELIAFIEEGGELDREADLKRYY